MSYLSVSTWSLHRMIGPLRWTEWDQTAGTHRTNVEEQPQLFTLLELPEEAAKRGYQAVEICHFHFPRTDEAYLLELKEACAKAGIAFDTLLLDYGDLTTLDEARFAADNDLMREWIRIASVCGAKQIRIVAGEAPPSDEAAVAKSAQALSDLGGYASELGVRVITENFKPLTSTGESSLKLLTGIKADVAFITDFGNYKGPSKYEEIAMTAPKSVSVHVKPVYDGQGCPDERELKQGLEAVQPGSYKGAYVLIYDGPGDMWEGLERVKRIVLPYLA